MRDIYASHMKVLAELGAYFYIKSVLELGCGQYSTLMFLDRQKFPHLDTLVTLEDNQGWYNSIDVAAHEKYNDLSTDRWVFTYTHNPMHKAVANLDLSSFDLIFVDNGQDILSRVEALEVLSDVQPRGMVVVHDYENREYQHSTQKFPIKTVYSVATPWTAVLYSTNSPEYKRYILR
jgi:predicted O-methyltransferase YrrM